MQDLFDKHSRIILTRPRKISNSTAKMLQARGYQTIIEPLFFVKSRNLDHNIFSDKNIQAILISSSNAVFALEKLKIQKNQLILAIGKRSAAQIQKLGYGNIIIANNSALSLLKLSEQTLRRDGGEIIYFSGEKITRDLTISLSSKGFLATRIITYETKARKSLSKQIIWEFQNKNNFKILAYSRNTVSIFFNLLKKDNLLAHCPKMKLLCFSNKISKYAKELGFNCATLKENEFE